MFCELAFAIVPPNQKIWPVRTVALGLVVAFTLVLSPGLSVPVTAQEEPNSTQGQSPTTTPPTPTTTPTTTPPPTTTQPELSFELPESGPEDFGLPQVDPALAISQPLTPSTNSLYIDAAYQALLRRPADSTGAAFWLDAIVSGGHRSRQQLANKLLFSPEGASNEVVRAYRDLLNRFPDQSGWDHWSALLQSSRVDELRILIMTSDEYLTINGGDAGYVNALYLELLGRSGEDEGLEFWQTELAKGVPRRTVVEAIYNSDEGLGNRTSSYYEEFLNRRATEAERSAGIEVIRAQGERVLFAQVFASDEKFDQFFNQVFGPTGG